MALSVIFSAILGYLLVIFIIHHMFKKFFHLLIFISFIVFAIVIGYIMIKGI